MTDKITLSERALGFLVQNGCMPPGWSRGALIDWLAQHGAPCFDALVSWEEALHAIREQLYLPRSPCASAPKACRERRSNTLLMLPDGLHYWTMAVRLRGRIPTVQEHEGKKLVLFGETGWAFFYMDEAGRVFHSRPPQLATCTLVASSPFVHLERAVLDVLGQRARATLSCEGNVAERLAEALEVPLIPEASDAIEQVRGDARFLLRQRTPVSAEAFLFSLDDAPRLLRALKELGIRASLKAPFCGITFEPAEAAPPLVEPQGEEVARLWSFGGIQGFLHVEGGTLVQSTGRRTEARRRMVSADRADESRRCLLTEADLSMFSPRARHYLLATDARRDPVLASKEGELSEMLARWGLVSYEALERVNAEWAGFAWGNAETPNQLGTFGILLEQFPPPDPPLPRRTPGSTRDLGLTWEGRELVIIGATASTTMYLDHDGSILEHESSADQLFPSASSLIRRIEFEATLEAVTGPMGQYAEGACAGSVGARLARELGLAEVPEASDRVRSWWIGEHVSVNELYSPMSGERITAIFADDEERLGEVVERGGSLG